VNEKAFAKASDCSLDYGVRRLIRPGSSLYHRQKWPIDVAWTPITLGFRF